MMDSNFQYIVSVLSPFSGTLFVIATFMRPFRRRWAALTWAKGFTCPLFPFPSFAWRDIPPLRFSFPWLLFPQRNGRINCSGPSPGKIRRGNGDQHGDSDYQREGDPVERSHTEEK